MHPESQLLALHCADPRCAIRAGCSFLGNAAQDYTTNAIESLNSVVRKSTRKRKIFPHDHSAFKVVYLAIQQAYRHREGRAQPADSSHNWLCGEILSGLGTGNYQGIGRML